MVKIVKRLLRDSRGSMLLIESVFVLLVIAILIVGSIVLIGEAVRINDLQQIAQLMAREVSLCGEWDNTVNSRLADLEALYDMDVDMVVTGDFIGSSKKLKLESSFEVSISYNSSYGVGGIDWNRSMLYVRKASGIVEEYHK